MSLYRTSRHSDHLSLLELVDTPEKATLIIKNNYSKSDIFYNYYCGLPVDHTCITRFGFLNCSQRPLYLSEVLDTTLYEYTYWLLKNSHELNLSPIRAYIYKIDMSKMGNFIDLTNHPDLKQLMDMSDVNYTHSHSFMKNLQNLPDFVIYPSIRTPHIGSLNFAYFRGSIDDNSICSILSISKDNKHPTDRVHIVSNDGGINNFYKPLKY